MRLSALFDNPNLGWGLRGDPYLWKALEAHFSKTDMPESSQDLIREVGDAYQSITGQSLDCDDNVYVAELAHGGMSSGYVCPTYWRETAIPYLLRRFREQRRDCG